MIVGAEVDRPVAASMRHVPTSSLRTIAWDIRKSPGSHALSSALVAPPPPHQGPKRSGKPRRRRSPLFPRGRNLPLPLTLRHLRSSLLPCPGLWSSQSARRRWVWRTLLLLCERDQNPIAGSGRVQGQPSQSHTWRPFPGPEDHPRCLSGREAHPCDRADQRQSRCPDRPCSRGRAVKAGQGSARTGPSSRGKDRGGAGPGRPFPAGRGRQAKAGEGRERVWGGAARPGLAGGRRGRRRAGRQAGARHASRPSLQEEVTWGHHIRETLLKLTATPHDEHFPTRRPPWANLGQAARLSGLFAIAAEGSSGLLAARRPQHCGSDTEGCGALPHVYRPACQLDIALWPLYPPWPASHPCIIVMRAYGVQS